MAGPITTAKVTACLKRFLPAWSAIAIALAVACIVLAALSGPLAPAVIAACLGASVGSVAVTGILCCIFC